MKYRFKFAKIICILISISSVSAAASCLLSEAMKDPILSGNSEFRNEYGKLSAKGNVEAHSFMFLA